MKKQNVLRLAAVLCTACLIVPVSGYAADTGADETVVNEAAEVPVEPQPEPQPDPQPEPEPQPVSQEEVPVEKQTENTTECTTETFTEVSTVATTEILVSTETTIEATTEAETTTETTTEAKKTNEELLASVHLVTPSITSMSYEFRFQQDTSAEQAAILKGTKVYESGSAEAKIIGISAPGSRVSVLADADRDWVFIESGRVRGFVRKAELITGDALEKMKADDTSGRNERRTISGDQTGACEGDQVQKIIWQDAECTVSPLENEAFTYTKTTAHNPVAEKVSAYAASDGVKVYSASDWETGTISSSASVVGTMCAGAVAYILEDADRPAVYIESGDVRGFVNAEDLIIGGKEESAAGNPSFAEAAVSLQDNPALYYTVTSVRAADANAYLRQELIAYALQFVGNRYVYGGNSLTDGIDCSGFTQQIYAHFGYTLDRTAADQSVTAGIQIPISCAIPGDLIFYAVDGEIGHVAIYIGNNKTVQAANSREGIIVREGIGANALWAGRVIQ